MDGVAQAASDSLASAPAAPQRGGSSGPLTNAERQRRWRQRHPELADLQNLRVGSLRWGDAPVPRLPPIDRRGQASSRR